MRVEFENNHIWVKIPYDKRSLAENNLNGIYSKKRNAFRFPRNIHAMRELLRFFPELKDHKEFVEVGKNAAATRQNFLSLKAQEDSQFIQDDRLRAYQRADIDYLMRLPAAGIFNEPRTGKTPTSIILMRELGTKRNLVISPASLIWNWEKEFKKWWPECYVYVYGSKESKKTPPVSATYKEEYNVVIVSKDTLKTRPGLFNEIHWDTCFVDEAHYLRNYKSKQSQAIFSIKAGRRYALTGTPTVKSTDEIFGILHYLYPEKYTSYWQFIGRYFTEEFDWMGHRRIGEVKANRKEELQELIGFISVQRKRSEVMQWLPIKEVSTISVKLEGKQAKFYKDMLDGFMATDEETGHEVDTSGVLAQLMRLRQICLDPELLGFTAPSAKTAAILDYVESDSSPLVIMSQFTSYLKLLAAKLVKLGIKVGMIHGEMSNQAKMQAAEQFQEGKIQILLCNIISAGTGFTLDRGETIIFTDLAWNPADNEQAEARILPTTEDRNHKVSIIHIVAEDTVDSRILELLQNKQSLTDIINNGGMEAIRRLLNGS